MCDPVTAAVTLATGVSGAAMQRRAQNKALRAQERAQAENIAAQERLNANRRKAEANARRTPNYGALFDANRQRRGGAATMLTGAQGVSGSSLSLAKNTLLGGGGG